MDVRTTLAFRKAGEHDWVEIDPSTPSGQRLLAALGISHPMEEVMTATTAATADMAAGVRNVSYSRPHIVPGDNAGNMGALLRFRNRISGYGVKLRGTARRAWGWVVRKLHLQTVVDYVKGAAGWVWNKITAAGRFLGTGGMTGAGLLAVSTDTGRSALRMLFKPVGWALGLIGRLWVGAEDMFFDEKREGGIRNAISNKMADIRIALFGEHTSAGKIGMIPSALVWTLNKTGRHLHVDSFAMRTARAAGIALVAPSLLGALGFLPLGVFYLPAQMLLGAWLTYAATSPFYEDAKRIGGNLVKELRSDAKTADRVVGKTEDKVVEQISTTAQQVIVTPARPQNREQRRAAKKTAGAR